MKTFRYLLQVGKARHCVFYSGGIKTHQDGSLFADVEICGNKRKLKRFLAQLKTDGYCEA